MEQRIFKLARAGGIDTNPSTFSQRAGTFASAATNAGTATLLTRRERTGLHGYLILPAKAVGSNAALHLAQTVGARAEEAELPHDLADTPVIGELVYHQSPALRETQNGIDPTELPRLLATAMPEGTWIAVTMRKPSNKERRRHSIWLAHRMGTAVPTHHSLTPNAVIVTITAGAESKEAVSSLLSQVTAGLPGFDLDTVVRPPRRFHTAAFGLPAGAAVAGGAAVGGPMLPESLAAVADASLPGMLVTGGILAATGVAALAGAIKSPERRLRESLAASLFPAPPVLHSRPKPPRKEQTVKGHTKVAGEKVPFEKHISASDGDYPLAPRTFMVGPNVVVGMVSPHAGAISGAAATKARPTPPAMLANIGPMLGTNDDGAAHLSAAAMLFGVAIVGKPGSGKSLSVRALFGWHCLERVRPSGRPGYPGRNNTLIAFESKGDGVAKYVQWAHAMGDKTLVIDAADPATPAIDIFSVPGDITSKAHFFTNAMRYAFGDQSIGERSYETLVSVLTGGMAVTEEVLEFMEGRDERLIPAGQSPIFYAHLLLGGISDTVATELWNGINGLAKRLRERGTPNTDLDLAVAELAKLYDGRTESARRSFLEAPRNKISQLLALESWWSPNRRKVTWEQILEGHRSVVINTGSSTTGILLEDSQTQQLSSMLMFSLQNALKRHCSGWLEQGRSVSIFADELSLLAGTSPEIIGWIRDQGRSYGIRAILATQRPEQLGAALRNNFLTYSTLISFAQTDVTTATEVAANVGSHGEWSTEDIQHLEPYHVVVRSEVDQRRQSAFIVKLPNFEADMAAYPAVQGYGQPNGADLW
ncbi:type IV secretory system conjugative DNA transfer family protein [Arthrobacter caoxuetaonis]|uniref:Type IV secretory system conjugative DNA transfer family protein n=1 Tax=Arthrobacter caoxuetaonis TaxID=2886935 RepID=A0A9X1SD47_9MICC|nr:type IV secretory system conjugative DNA transfer family protein [Arthrobacter caoxuetaonis]MCC3299335.1 type IV secretory system conjugative DNA transfer family protein [Arthrobacter caoxuetaonis]USQ59172.1 type IV secretory system conjugative DNA transfer family protein [Arthrobacter caoxuetaonis]